MSRRTAAWLAWSLAMASLVLLAATVAISYISRSAVPASQQEVPFWVETLWSVGGAAYPLVGALVASRRPGNAVGWLLCCVGLAIASSGFTEAYAPYARAISLPGAEAAAFLYDINPGGLLAIFVVLLFPDGRLPSRRWRSVVWLASAQIVLALVMGSLGQGGADPLGTELPVGVFKALSVLNSVLIIGTLVGAVALVAFRMRRANGDERQQIKWFIYAVSVIGAGGLASVLAPLFWIVTLIGIGAVPVVVGIAILKYRLYEIDIIINRTLVYGSLTATLVAIYFGGIVLLQRVFVVFTGQKSTLAVVASTLLIAALFNPLHRRIQSFIDRSFYRSKYDARKTLEAYSVKLRDETDLEALNEELVGVVRETMQPAHVSLWLRPQTAPEGEVSGVKS